MYSGFTISFNFHFFWSDFLDFKDESYVKGGLLSIGGILVEDDWGVLVGDGIRVLVNDGIGVMVSIVIGVMVGDGIGVLVGYGVGGLVEDGGGVLVGEHDGVLVREEDGEGFSSLIIVRLRGGESSITSSSSWVVVSVFGMSNRIVLGLFTYEKYYVSESL